MNTPQKITLGIMVISVVVLLGFNTYDRRMSSVTPFWDHGYVPVRWYYLTIYEDDPSLAYTLKDSKYPLIIGIIIVGSLLIYAMREQSKP